MHFMFKISNMVQQESQLWIRELNQVPYRGRAVVLVHAPCELHPGVSTLHTADMDPMIGHKVYTSLNHSLAH